MRFYSDAGLLPPSGRTEAGHRRCAATDVARPQLVRTLRDLSHRDGRALCRRLIEQLDAHT
jgi:DNA-binding transcriptional MerR regulator